MTLHIRSEMPEQKVYSPAELARYPYLFRCAYRGCIESLAARTIEDVERLEAEHVCKEGVMFSEIITPTTHEEPTTHTSNGGATRLHNGRKTVSEYLRTRGGIVKMWEMCDKTYDEYRNAPADRKDYFSNMLTGMTEMLFIAMTPYFANRNEVVREVMARGAARDAGSAHETKGIGWISISPQDGGVPWEQAFSGTGYTSNPAHMKTPPPGYPEELVAKARATLGVEAKKEASRVEAKPVVVKHGLSDEKVEELKGRKAMGFDDKMLCAAYKLTPAQLKAALAS